MEDTSVPDALATIRSFPSPGPSIITLTVGQGTPGDRSNRGTVCEDEDSAKELKKKSLKKKSLKNLKKSLKKNRAKEKILLKYM